MAGKQGRALAIFRCTNPLRIRISDSAESAHTQVSSCKQRLGHSAMPLFTAARRAQEPACSSVPGCPATSRHRQRRMSSLAGHESLITVLCLGACLPAPLPCSPAVCACSAHGGGGLSPHPAHLLEAQHHRRAGRQCSGRGNECVPPCASAGSTLALLLLLQQCSD